MDEMERDKSARGHLLLAGGGSAGHVYPGLAVGDALVGRGWRVSWLGRRAGMERDLVMRRGLEYHGLPARALVGRSPLARAAALATTALSALRARSLLRRLEVDAVLGTGGYACAPAVLGARLAARPAFLLEPNARAGTANRWLARWAAEIFLGFAETAAEISGATRHTGVPVRSDFFPPHPLPPLPPRLLVLGGSQGAREINQLMPEVAELLGGLGTAAEILHQCGAAHAEAVEADYAGRDLEAVRVEVVPFLDDVATAMKGCHLVVSRAGALTLAETCAAGRGSLLVPLALAGGHQRDNAERLVAAGAAEIVSGDRADDIAARLVELFATPDTLQAMSRAAASLAKPDAADQIAAAISERLGSGGGG